MLVRYVCMMPPHLRYLEENSRAIGSWEPGMAARSSIPIDLRYWMMLRIGRSSLAASHAEYAEKRGGAQDAAETVLLEVSWGYVTWN